ncbi:hypothetical protein [Levilactobacillus acidifarinae]|uniref:Cps1F protein n=1 Tax=Levilactobacillus acidifarinae DSM 19394 = JCM 15949 TaxID=1423715 RepID=A0A0R1LQV2_9LACO|nr:hypothetical protein [Levilactobacillus acidifarinae]KRK95129.1 cps1F protein [Levilactobacillus acidifarinae DSM 19394]GEO70628.1 polysaccharide biosynthesis protein, chain length regulator [Levilactobacillus acidifarinae]
MESKFSFLPFVKVLWHRLFWILLIAVIGGVAGYYVTKRNFVPAYTVASTVNVHHKASPTQSKTDVLNADIARLGTVQSQLGDVGIFRLASKRVKVKHNVSFSTEYLMKHVNVIAKPSSTILQVAATSRNAVQASWIVNAVIYSYENKYTKVDKTLLVTQLSPASADWATETKPDYSQPIKKWALIAAVVAYAIFMFGYALKERREGRRKH